LCGPWNRATICGNALYVIRNPKYRFNRTIMANQTIFLPQVGSGYTVEGQKTREEKFGGLQIEIIPSYETGLRTYLLEASVSESTTEPFVELKILDEQKTPSELKLTPGAKIRSYPSSPTYYAPYEICDFTEATSTDATRLKVR
jgi:hypothetical protein